MKKQKVYSKPIKVDFYTKGGEKVVFKALKTYTKPLKVEFYKDGKKVKFNNS